jgi:hypothetical protein
MISWIKRMRRLLSILKKLFFGREESLPSTIIVAPSYDEVTAATARWVSSLALDGAALRTGGSARHSLIAELLSSPTTVRKLLIFVGHGKAGGLLTKRTLGKPNSPLCSGQHGCLIDTEDISRAGGGLHVMAWACEAGIYFGPRVASLKDSAFLGFSGALNLVINHEESEQLVWIPLMRELFARVLEKGRIDRQDSEMLSSSLLEVREKIKAGVINTGIHNRFNRAFLKTAARNVVLYTSQE